MKYLLIILAIAVAIISALYWSWPVTLAVVFLVLLVGYNLCKRSKPDCGCGCGGA